MLVVVVCLALAASSGSPIGFARAEIARVAGAGASRVDLRVVPGAKESFRIAPSGNHVVITGGDAVGAMYGAFEFTERLRNLGVAAWKTRVSDQPYLSDRGVNLFLTLPWDYRKNNTDYDQAALVDPNRWWFQNEGYWKTLLDMMARSRLNWLDIHGMWDISVTDAPNLYSYFVQTKSFAAVGVADQVKAADLRQLNHVIDMAHARGIRVSLMSYQADLRTHHNPSPPYSPTEANVYKYTEEAVESMIRGAPGLDAIGFRIGESGRSESFFQCYLDAVRNSGRNIPLITRSWITKKQNVLPLARRSTDFSVEVKYNGEHWGAPYPVAGGRVPNWYSYSFEDYLSDSGDSSTNAKTWPGWPSSARATQAGASKGAASTWPSEPYKVVWQVRANGTHRILPFYNPEWTRRSILAMKLGTASGYTVEGLDAYFPKSPDYYLARPQDKAYEWNHQRDEMYWMCWGRLGYDPSTPERVFDERAVQIYGPGSKPLIDAWKRTSVLVPEAFMAYGLGPDHRNHAPELEWGGDTSDFVHGQGFDSHVCIPVDEELANLATGGVDGRIPPRYMWLGTQSDWDRTADRFESSTSPRLREIALAVSLQGALGSYYDFRFWGAWRAALSESATGTETSDENDSITRARASFDELASNSYFKPFTDRLRMHTNSFSWKQEMAKVLAEQHRIKMLPTHPGPREAARFTLPSKRSNLTWRAEGQTIKVKLEIGNCDSAWLLVKALPSSTYFHKLPMRKSGKSFVAGFTRSRCGNLIAAEAGIGNQAVRIPDVLLECPYEVIPAEPGPTPPVYNAAEAMTYLRPDVITPKKYAGLLIGTRSGDFFTGYDMATKRKLLEPVHRGLRLVILQEDFNKFKLDWLPQPLAVQPAASQEFDPAGALGLPQVRVPGIMWQGFGASPGWQIYGNGGLARMSYGKGEIWVTTARLMQNMQYPNAARAFVKLLSLGGKAKPTILVDSCSESAVYSSSCHPDLMNSHNIPFLTMGEVISKEQGMDSTTPVAGPIGFDAILAGRGEEIANTFLRNRVVALASRPTPASLVDFELERLRRKRELMRTLGLDPLPPKTPLNARTTGTIERNGYTIEKVVYESRPKFYVTGHLYKPNGWVGGRLPVILNVNGHWAHKKDEDRVQLRCASEALHGYLAFAIDSPGFSFEGNSLIERRAEGNHNDYKLVEGGTNATGYYVWDSIRALDYLETRFDVDMTRIGITGASGGGLATLYAFAADDRYKAAVPVVYMSSMQLAPDNGCLCNHVPGTCQVGDRSDVISVQAPKPVLLMGAQEDREFPPDAMRLTHQKMADTWKLFQRDNDVFVKIFPGGHDYSQPMRESMIGFFDKYLLGSGDGRPMPEPAIQVLDPENRSILALDPPLAERTMRDLSLERLVASPKAVSVDDAIGVNGGAPSTPDLHYTETGTGKTRLVTFESEPGLTTPAVLLLPDGPVRGVRIVARDSGKASDTAEKVLTSGYATLLVDILGTGELSKFDMRYAVYAGRSIAFTGGWQLAQAVVAMSRYSDHVELIGDGPLASQAAMWAGLLSRKIEKVRGLGCLRSWQEAMGDEVSDLAVQPRANLCGTLDYLRSQVNNSEWSYRN